MRKERPWVKKFETGEYLSEWHGYDPTKIGGPYSDYMDIGEETFAHCIGSFEGIGTVTWWVAKEIAALSDDERKLLLDICSYKEYLSNTLDAEFVNRLAKMFGCWPFHIHRTGQIGKVKMSSMLDEIILSILKRSQGCRDPKTIEFREKNPVMNVITFDSWQKGIRPVEPVNK